MEAKEVQEPVEVLLPLLRRLEMLLPLLRRVEVLLGAIQTLVRETGLPRGAPSDHRGCLPSCLCTPRRQGSHSFRGANRVRGRSKGGS